MIKSVFAAAAAAPFLATAAMAGPYVNVEANSGFAGSDYLGTTTEAHLGYEGTLGESASWYVQGGPGLVAPDGGDSKAAFTGKGGGSVSLTDSLSVYGELSFASVKDAAEVGYGTKAGLKWTF